jgi:hypothetical protein
MTSAKNLSQEGRPACHAEHIVWIDRLDCAGRINRPEVWSRFAKAQRDNLRIKDIIGDYSSLDFLVLIRH